jgi:hypothetical protein
MVELDAFQVEVGGQLADMVLYVAQAVHQSMVDASKVALVIVIWLAQFGEGQHGKDTIDVGGSLRGVLECFRLCAR